MNAHDLAEGILAIEERIFLTSQEHKLFQNSANMLRQQADRIAELEKNVEPVAIVNTNCENNIQWNVLKPQSYNGYFLFTTPQTKPLSDEEIELIAHRVFEVRDTKEALFDFARAIEERILGK